MQNPIRLILDWYHRLNIRLQIVVALIGSFGLVIAALITGWFTLQAARVKAPVPTQEQMLNKQVAGVQVGGDVQASGNVDYTVSVYQGSKEQDMAVSEVQQRQKALVAISRHLEDFKAELQDIVDQHGKSIDRIAGDMNAKEMYGSGRHLRLQYEQVRESQRKLDESWLKCQRGVEDAMLDTGMTEISDTELKARYLETQETKQQALNQVLSMTDNYFVTRKTFGSDMIESAKKEVFGTP